MRKLITTILVLIGLLFSLLSFHKNSHNLKVAFLDVGQGDAILIQTPASQKILIDGGPNNSILKRLGENLAWGDKKIDLIILTHPHADHLMGLIEVIKRYQVNQIVVTNIDYSNKNYEEFLRLAKSKNIPIIKGFYPKTINFSDDCDLKIIYPLDSNLISNIKNLNDTSLVAQLDCAKIKILFTGDAEKNIEQKLLANKIDLRSNILKIGHHGSAQATSLKFYREINPQISIIEVGRNNSYHLPSPQTIETLEKSGTKILRTDISGTIRLLIENGQISMVK